jgi:integrase/recombinase XerD
VLTITRSGGRGSFRPFLHHISKGKPRQGRAIALKSAKKLPRVLTVTETQTILDSCDHLRDRLLFAVLHETGMRIGEALGLRHEDIAAAEREIVIVARANDNRARTKSPAGRTIPVGASLVRLYADYLHHEYGDLDSDYVFVNLFAQPRGRALAYPAVHDLVVRLRKKTGIDFDPHWLRHSAAARMLRDGVPIEVVATLLGHASTTTTLQIYGHLSVADARRALEDAGWFDGAEVAL